MKRTKKAKVTKRSNKRTVKKRGMKIARGIGKVLPFRGGKVKIVEKVPNAFVARVVKPVTSFSGRTIPKGRQFKVSTTWVYKTA